MNLDRHPELLDRLAADYLTGGMGPAARRRFEALQLTLPQAAQSVQRWRERLDGALLHEPPAQAWAGIEQRIAGARADSARTQPLTGWGLRAWRALALGLGGVAAASLAVLVAVVLQRPATPARQFVAVLQGPAGHAAVLDVRGERAVLTAVGEQPAPAGKSFELWVLPRQGRPIAAGVVRLQGSYRMAMPAQLLEASLQARGFAISVEPQGGSPTGQPTGPVTYVGQEVAEAPARSDAG